MSEEWQVNTPQLNDLSFVFPSAPPLSQPKGALPSLCRYGEVRWLRPALGVEGSGSRSFGVCYVSCDTWVNYVWWGVQWSGSFGERCLCFYFIMFFFFFLLCVVVVRMEWELSCFDSFIFIFLGGGEGRGRVPRSFHIQRPIVNTPPPFLSI